MIIHNFFKRFLIIFIIQSSYDIRKLFSQEAEVQTEVQILESESELPAESNYSTELPNQPKPQIPSTLSQPSAEPNHSTELPQTSSKLSAAPNYSTELPNQPKPQISLELSQASAEPNYSTESPNQPKPQISSELSQRSAQSALAINSTELPKQSPKPSTEPQPSTKPEPSDDQTKSSSHPPEPPQTQPYSSTKIPEPGSFRNQIKFSINPRQSSENESDSSNTAVKTNNTLADVLSELKEAKLTYKLGLMGFNPMYLNYAKKKLTYFAPTDAAWEEDLLFNYPETYKIIMQEPDLVMSLLERQLIISEDLFTVEKIAEETKDKAIRLPTIRGLVQIKVQNHQILWIHENITIVQANIPCSNGIIHLVNKFFLQPGEIPLKNTSSSHKLIYNFTLLFITCMCNQLYL